MTLYRERLWASAWIFVATALIIPTAILVFLPIDLLVGILIALFVYAAIVFGLVISSPVVEVTTEAFLAGRARLPIEYVGQVAGFLAEDASLERGQRLDARAWLMIRGWVSPVVTVAVNDPEDPTPYWVVSTRRPEAVVAAVAEAKKRSANAASNS